MRKKILTMAIAMWGLFGLATMAQTETTCPNAEACQAQGNKMYQPQVFTDYAFEGILLEPAQQAKVDAINAQMKDAVNGPVGMSRAMRGAKGVCPDSTQCKDKCKGECKDKCKDKCKGECKNKCEAGEGCSKKAVEGCPQAEQDQNRCPNAGIERQHRGGMRGGAEQVTMARKAYAQKMKEVLTPEQYVMFLENIAFAPQEQPQMGMGGRMIKNPRKK